MAVWWEEEAEKLSWEEFWVKNSWRFSEKFHTTYDFSKKEQDKLEKTIKENNIVFLPNYKLEVVDEGQKRNGETFEVIGIRPKDDYDYDELGVMFIVQFEDGKEMVTFPEEIMNEDAF